MIQAGRGREGGQYVLMFSHVFTHPGPWVHFLQILDIADLAVVHCRFPRHQWGEGGQEAETKTETQESVCTMTQSRSTTAPLIFDYHWVDLFIPLSTILYVLLVSFYTHECFPPDYNYCTSDSAWWCSFYTLFLEALWDSLVMSPVTWHGTRRWGPMGLDTLSP